MFLRLLYWSVFIVIALAAEPGMGDVLPGKSVVVSYAYALDGSDPVNGQTVCLLEASCELGGQSELLSLTLALTGSGDDVLDIACRRMPDDCALSQYAGGRYEHRQSVERFDIFSRPGHRWDTDASLVLLNQKNIGWLLLSYEVPPRPR